MLNLFCIFDLDGTLVDTGHLHSEAWVEACKAYGPLTDDEEIRRLHDAFSVGLAGRPKVRKLIEQRLIYPVADLQKVDMIVAFKERQFERLFERGAREIPGARAFLEKLSGCGVPLAVATTALRRQCEGNLKRLGMWGNFQASVCREDVARLKPAPDCFLQAADAIGALADVTVVFEDSPPGFAAVGKTPFALIGLRMSEKLAGLHRPLAVIENYLGFEPQKLCALLNGG